MKENKKIKNAKESIFKGIKFKSKLEESFFKILIDAGFNPGYESMKFILMEGFKPTIPFFNRSKAKKEYVLDMNKIRDITYTPDFTLLYNDVLFIIEAKGIENDTFPLKKKLFRKLIESLKVPCVYFEVRTKKELLTVIEIIKNYESPTQD